MSRVLPETVGDLIDILSTYPKDHEIFIQGDTVRDPEATPQHFVVEEYKDPESIPSMILLAGIPVESEEKFFTDYKAKRKEYPVYHK